MRRNWFLSVAMSLLLAAAGLFGMAAPARAIDYPQITRYRQGAATEKVAKALPGVSIVENASSLNIGRAKPGASKPGNVSKGWTIFVYLCGSDLETDASCASDNLEDMLVAKGSDNVRFVIEAGGADEWTFEGVDASKLTRLTIQNGASKVVETVADKSMGDASTLQDFVSWGVKNYPSEHMGLIMWDHGGGSVGGACFDQKDDVGLTLADIDSALCGSFKGMWDKFDFIGFDCCLMSCLEVANVCATYADYLYGSQEIEPGTGWDYTAMGDFLAANANADAAALGRTVADSYISKSGDDATTATFSITDLTKVDSLLRAFDKFSKELYQKTDASDVLTQFVREALRVDNFGSNNKAEGYTNLIDLAGLSAVAAPWCPSAAELAGAIKNSVVYQRDQSAHAGAGGLSVYYPLDCPDSDVLKVFETIAVNPSYLAFVDRLTHGQVYGTTDDYDDSIWLTPTKSVGNGYWDYVDAATGQSRLIEFAEAPYLDAQGTYTFRLTDKALDKTSTVSALVYMPSADGVDLIALGETFDVNADWKTGVVGDAFDGLWLSLPDGQNLCAYPADWTDEYAVYSCPVRYNGDEAYLRVRVYNDATTVIEGIWDGISESGAIDRAAQPLTVGATIAPLYDSFDANDDFVENSYVGSDVTVTEDFAISYGTLLPDDYTYAFLIRDVYGNYYETDAVTFTVDADGKLFFEA